MRNRLVPPVGVDATELADLRRRVRSFVRSQIDVGAFTPGVDTWLTRWDRTFTKALAAEGWVGMTIPKAYGGHGRSFLERFVVTEELLAAGAPVAAHWVADRQAAPSLLKFGTEEQKLRYLPGIAAGDLSWAIGMSESESGSDLASVRTKAVQVEDGWRLTGAKLWTSGAHRADAFFALARSAPLDSAHRHEGLSQFIVPLDSPGITIRPIYTLAGEHHFNEVIFDDVFVPDSLVLGTIGSGWSQVMSELGFERSGPERFLSTFPLLAASLDLIASDELPRTPAIGRLMGRLVGLHQLSLSVAETLSRGDNADTAAAVVKVLGTRLEGDISELLDELCDGPIPGEDGERFGELLRAGIMQRPGFTLRGGTTEILCGGIARGLGMR